MSILNWLRRNLLYARDEDYFPDCRVFLDNRDAMLELFHQAAMAAGKPRGLRWVSVEPVAEPVFVLDNLDGLLLVLWPLNVEFEPVPNSEMEDVPQATGSRGVIATFSCKRRRWQTNGYGVFNMSIEKSIGGGILLSLIDFNPHRTA